MLVLAWALPAAHRGGQAYQDAILWGQTAGRLAGDANAPELNAHGRPLWWYLPLLPVLFFPWSVWPPLWRAAAGWRALRDDLGARLLVAWLAPAFLAFSLIGGKQLHYLVPLLPALALLAARALAERGPQQAARADLGPALSLLAVCAIGLGLAPFVHPRFYAWDNHELSLASWAAAIPWWAGPLLAAPLVLAWLTRPVRAGAAARDLALALGAVFVALTAIAAPMASEAFDLRPLAQDIARWQEEGPVARLTPYYGEYQFLGRLRAPVVRLGADELAGWVRAHPDGRLILGFGAHRPAPPWFGPPESVRSYRGVLLGVWRCATLRARLPTAAAIPPRPWRRPRPPYWQRRSRPVVAESPPLPGADRDPVHMLTQWRLRAAGVPPPAPESYRGCRAPRASRQRCSHFRSSATCAKVFPPAISAARRCSRSRMSWARLATSTASRAGMMTRPSSSPTSQSPGFAWWLPSDTGTPMAPRPRGSPASGQALVLHSARPEAAMSARSRQAPRMTTPPRPRSTAVRLARPPHSAGYWSPASITSTSPGLQASIACTGFDQSPATVSTVDGRAAQAHGRVAVDVAAQRTAAVHGVGEVGRADARQHRAHLGQAGAAVEGLLGGDAAGHRGEHGRRRGAVVRRLGDGAAADDDARARRHRAGRGRRADAAGAAHRDAHRLRDLGEGGEDLAPEHLLVDGGVHADQVDAERLDRARPTGRVGDAEQVAADRDAQVAPGVDAVADGRVGGRGQDHDHVGAGLLRRLDLGAAGVHDLHVGHHGGLRVGRAQPAHRLQALRLDQRCPGLDPGDARRQRLRRCAQRLLEVEEIERQLDDGRGGDLIRHGRHPILGSPGAMRLTALGACVRRMTDADL